MRKIVITLLVFLGISSNLFASATIFKEDGGDTVRFQVNVEASVYMNSGLIGEVSGGNFTHQFSRDAEGSKTITFKKDGYKDSSVTINRQMDYLVLANILGSYFSTSSTTTDMVNGNHKKHTPNQFMINMQKID